MSEPQLLRLTGVVEIMAGAAEGAEKPARVRILAYSGQVMDIPHIGPAILDLNGLDCSATIQLLADHKNDLANLLGSGTATVVNGRQLLVQGTLSRSSEASQKIIALSKDGIQFQASVGVHPIEREHIAPNKTVHVNGRSALDPRGFLLVKRGILREVSICPLACDATTNVSIAATTNRRIDVMTPTNSQTIMPEISMLPEDADGLSPVERIQARWTREQWHDSNGGPRHRGRSAMMSACAGRITYEDFERELLKAKLADSELALMKAQSPKGPSVCAPRERPTGDVLQAALLCHLGHEQVAVKALGEQATECARQLRCHHMLDIVRAGYNAVGAPIPADRNEMITASASIMSLPGLLGNAAGKLLLDAYQAFPSVARQIAKKLTASDFKAHTGYRLTGDMKFQEVTPDGQIKHGQLAESSYPYRIDTYGRMFGLTRQDIINDDLGAFESMPSIIGRGAAVALEELFWKLVLANTGSFFSGANYLSGGTSVLALTGLGLAVAKMRQQTDAHGAPIVVVPKFLVVPPELEATADALYASTNIIATGTTDATQPDGNPYKGKYQPLVVPHLSNATYSGYSLTAWYLFGSPADVAAFGIAYLNGQESPTVESAQAEFSTLGWNYRGYLDMGVCQIDGKGAVKSAGA